MQTSVFSLLGTALLLAAIGPAPQALAAKRCTSEHRFFGDYPREKETGWHDEAQGVTHDEGNWFFSQNPDRTFSGAEACGHSRSCSRFDPRLWKLDAGISLSRKVGCGDPGVRCSKHFSQTSDIWLDGYDHFGDISHYQGFVIVGLDGQVGGNPLPSRLAIYDAEELTFLGYAGLPQVGGAGFAAVDSHGIVYVPRNDKQRLYRYRISWEGLRRNEAFRRVEQYGPISIVSDGVQILEELPALRLEDEEGQPLVIEHLQGADFTPDGRILYISSGYLSDFGIGGIHVFEVSDTEFGGACAPESGDCIARRIERSENTYEFVPSPHPQIPMVKISVEPETDFVYEYHSHAFTYEEPEGITYWDLFLTLDGETERTPVHTILLDNDGPLGEDDDVYLKHFSADLHCTGDAFVWLEAEDGTLVAPMQEDDHDAASRGGFAWVPDGASAPGGAARYTFTVPQAGEYAVWGRTGSDSEQADSFSVRMDGGPYLYWNTERGNGPDDWRWGAIRAHGQSQPRIYTLAAGTHTLEIHQAEPGTKLDRLLITDDVDFVPFTQFIEAESGALTAPMRVEPRSSFGWGISGGRYITVPNGAGSGGRASYVFAVPVPATYHVWGRVNAPSSGDDSFWVSIDSETELLWDTQRSTSWVWDQVSDRGAGNARFRLLDRLHLLEIRQREDGTQLDRILISNDPSFVPQVPKCFYGNCVYEPPSSDPPPMYPTNPAPVYGSYSLMW